MAELAHDKRQQILDAALRTFARYGFHKATIKRIAEEAGLKSPALIYWYFANKDELFHAVLMQLSPLLQQVTSPATLMGRPPQEVLTLVAQSYLSTFNDPDTLYLFRIFISEAARRPEVGEHFAQTGVMTVLNFLVMYFQHQVELGRLRPHDPQTSARAFLGTLVTYVLGREIFPPLRANLPEPGAYVRDIVGIFLDGLRAPGEHLEREEAG